MEYAEPLTVFKSIYLNGTGSRFMLVFKLFLTFY